MSEQIPGQMTTGRQLLSIIVPVYNEEQVLPEFNRRVTRLAATLDMDVELIFVNDGSKDGSLRLLHELRAQDARVAIVDLSRNFGKEIAMTAGLDCAEGDAVVLIDADLQDPPELIPELIAVWREGCDVAYAKRAGREGETVIKKATAHLFYRTIQAIGRFQIPEDTGDFRLMSRRAVEAIKQLREQHRFMKGLFAWIGFPQKAVLYRRDPRFAGETKWNYWKLWNFALDGITSFTTAPLKLATYCGLVISLCSFAYGSYIIVRTLLYGNPVPGYPSLMAVVLFLGGVQLVAVGLLGEYMGRMFDETKRRPLYLLNEHVRSAAGLHRWQASKSL